jgi:hypothetical protein
MILARSISRCGLVPALMICRSFRSRLMVIRTGTASGPATLLLLRVALITEECTRNGAEPRIPARRVPSRPGRAPAARSRLRAMGPQGLARRRWPEPGGPQAGQGGYCGRPSAAITGLGSGFSIHL